MGWTPTTYLAPTDGELRCSIKQDTAHDCAGGTASGQAGGC